MTSSGSSAKAALADYAAGRMTAQQLVGVVAAAYYGDGDWERGARNGLRPIIDVIERAHPGIVELSSQVDRPGFSVRLADRPFPKRLEGELREAITAVIAATAAPSPVPRPGLFTRLVAAVRRLFSASV